MRPIVRSLVLGVLAAASLAYAQREEPIPNWTSPPWWSPAAAVRGAGSPGGTRAPGALAASAVSAAPLPFVALVPCRIVDTRGGAPLGGGLLPASTPRDYTLAGQCGIPAGAGAASLNVTVTNTGGPGYVSIWPQGETQPVVSTLNYVADQTIANAAVVPLSGTGTVTLACMNSGCDLVLDTNGYYAAQAAVRSLNTLTGDVTLSPGANVTVTPAGNTLTIASATGAHTHDAADLATGTLPSARLSGAYTSALTLSSAANQLSAATLDLGTSGSIVRGANTLLLSSGPSTYLFLGNNAGNLTRTGTRSTGIGRVALSSLTSGSYNSALGDSAMYSMTTGSRNTALGNATLINCAAGNDNAALGHNALYGITGSENVGVGASALAFATDDGNTAVGKSALASLGTGSGNIALGRDAGSSLSTGSDNIFIGHGGSNASGVIRIGTEGTQTTAYLAGVYATALTGRAVYVDANGRLGTVASSRRFKEDISGIGDVSGLVARLRPVSFRYSADRDPSGARRYGLIAEEVSEVAPELVDLGGDRRPETVRYESLPALLLAEVQRQERKVVELTRALESALARIAALEGR